MVDANKLLAPQQTEHARGNGDALQRGAHAGAFGIANAVDIINGNAGFSQGLFHKSDNPGPVMSSRILGKKTFAWRGDECMADIGQDLGGAAPGRM